MVFILTNVGCCRVSRQVNSSELVFLNHKWETFNQNYMNIWYIIVIDWTSTSAQYPEQEQEIFLYWDLRTNVVHEKFFKK